MFPTSWKVLLLFLLKSCNSPCTTGNLLFPSSTLPIARTLYKTQLNFYQQQHIALKSVIQHLCSLSWHCVRLVCGSRLKSWGKCVETATQTNSQPTSFALLWAFLFPAEKRLRTVSYYCWWWRRWCCFSVLYNGPQFFSLTSPPLYLRMELETWNSFTQISSLSKHGGAVIQYSANKKRSRSILWISFEMNTENWTYRKIGGIPWGTSASPIIRAFFAISFLLSLLFFRHHTSSFIHISFTIPHTYVRKVFVCFTRFEKANFFCLFEESVLINASTSTHCHRFPET